MIQPFQMKIINCMYQGVNIEPYDKQ